MSATSRRERDREQRREAANHKIGHDNAYRIIYGPAYAKLALCVGALLGAWWVWHAVDHRWIALVNVSFGTVLLMVYTAGMVRAGSLYARQMRRATGQPMPWIWHALLIAGALFLAAAYAVYAA
jgi:hypothetical protein